MKKPPVKSYCGGKPNYCTPEETLILDRGCWERGCVAYDERDGDGVNISAERKREWQELDVNEVIQVISENITDPSPELLQELYGLVAGVDRWLQEKNSGS
jgi:hypothetical protein